MSRSGLLLTVLLLVSSALGSAPARAQIFGMSELRGGVVVAGADITAPGTGFGIMDGTAIANANVELLFDNPLLNMMSVFGTFRPHLGVNGNFSGHPSELYAGLSWTFVLFDASPVFVEASLGGMIDSAILPSAAMAPTAFTCSVALRGSASAGYAITGNFSLIATYERFQRMGSCGAGPPPPDDRLALRLGVRF